MEGTLKLNISKACVVAATLLMYGCGGGGDTTSVPQDPKPRCYYTADFVALNPSNVPYFAGMALIGHNQPATVPFDPVGIARHIADQVSATPTTDGYSSAGGTISVSSQVSGATGLGAMTITFNQHVSSGITLDGAVAVQINAVDPYSVSNDKTMTLSSFSVAGVYGSVTINGTVREVNTTSTLGATTDLTSKLTSNFIMTDAAGHELEMMDYIYAVSTSGFDGLIFSEKYDGKFYDSTYGCALIQNSSSISSNTLIIESLNPQTHRYDPLRTGSLGIFNTHGGADAKITLSTAGPALIEVDTTDDGVLDYSQATTWGAL